MFPASILEKITVNDGWIIVAALLVFLMQAGFLLIEAGSVRAKNATNVAQKNVSDMIICIACYSLVGFGLMYGMSFGGYIGMGGVKTALQDRGEWPQLLIFNLAFCAVVATIVSGAVAERMKIGAYFVSTAVIALLVYPVFGHWVWGNTIITSNLAYLANLGFVDHAGGIAIHALGGFYALAAIIVLGARQGRFDESGKVLPISGYSPVLALSGALILFVTWIPFNTGSLTPGTQLFADAALATVIAGAAGGLAGKTIGYFLQSKTFDPTASFNGILGGLVAVTSGVIFLGPFGAFAIGIIGGGAAILSNHVILYKFKIDDPVGVVGVHAIAGALGAVMFPIFAIRTLPAGSMMDQVFAQSFGLLACVAWAFTTGFIVFRFLKAVGKLRVSLAEEHLGLDIGEHVPNLSREHIEAGYEASQKAQASQLSLTGAVAPQGAIAGSEIGLALSVMSDENKRLNEEAIIRSAMFTEAIESLSDGLIIYDGDHNIVEFNSAYKDIMEAAKAECRIGMTRRDHITSLQKIGVPIEGQQTDSTSVAEKKFALGDAHYIHRSRLIPSGGAVATIMDVTEIQDALGKSELAKKAKSEFLANMSHEIRTPMNGIIGMTEVLRRSELNARQKQFVDTISSSGSALMTIINDILDFSKIEAGKVVLNPVPFVLRDSIEDVTTMLSSSASEKNLEVLVRVQPDLPATYVGDVGRFRQVMTNLVGNALKFTHFGHVLVDVSGAPNAQGVDLVIRIEDTGIGIAPDQIGDVFQKFKQVDGTTTREYEGTGLGLSITSNLIELMGGKISVESVLGKGSIFTIEISLPSHEDLKAVSQIPVEIIGATILIVDDNTVNRNILREQIKHWKCRSVAVESASKALKVLENARLKGIKIDLIISDYQMPGMNGEDFHTSVQARSETASIPFVMLTSINEDRLISRMEKKGVGAILTKPTRSSHLFDTLTQCILASQSTAHTPIKAKMDLSPARQASRPNPLPVLETKVAEKTEQDIFHKPRGLDVLVAEDNETNQIYIKYIMEELGLTFKIVPTGRAAVDFWRSENPSLILMDVSMPDMNGYEATQAIREDERKFNKVRTPIIAVTAHTLAGDEEKCLAAGMDDYLSKPVSIAGMQSKLTQWARANISQNVA